MTPQLLASKYSQTVESVADVGYSHTSTSVTGYNGYGYDSYSHFWSKFLSTSTQMTVAWMSIVWMTVYGSSPWSYLNSMKAG